MRGNPSPIDYQVYRSPQSLRDIFSIVEQLIFGILDARGNDWVTEELNHHDANIVIRNSYSDRLMSCEHDLRNITGGLEDKRVGTRNQPLHDIERLVAHLGIRADIGKIWAEKAEWFVRGLCP